VGIWFANYDYPTIFSIIGNNFTLTNNAIVFQGNIGGDNENNRSLIERNIIQNCTGGAIRGISLDYLARFKHTYFLKNAFINCQGGVVDFQMDYYYLLDILWDNGYFGNYYEEMVKEDAPDEDGNHIAEKIFFVSGEHGLTDEAPLLSLKMVQDDIQLISTHPPDIIRSTKEVKVNNSITWSIYGDIPSVIEIKLDGVFISSFDREDLNISVALSELSIGKHDLVLILSNHNQIYEDLVHINIFQSNINSLPDLFILTISPIILLLIVIGSIKFWKKKE
jgi:hypothetical protein